MIYLMFWMDIIENLPTRYLADMDNPLGLMSPQEIFIADADLQQDALRTLFNMIRKGTGFSVCNQVFPQ